MSRYLERSDGIIRVLKISYAFSQESIVSEKWNSREGLQNMVCNRDNNSSLVNLITKARENARSAQDHISKDLWQCLNEFYHEVIDGSLSERLRREDPVTILDNLTKYCVLYYGTADMTMVRGEGYFWISIGKFLERSLQVADLVARDLRDNASATESEMKAMINEEVLDANHPRSVIYSINRLYRYFERLRTEKNTDAYNKLNFMIGELNSRVRYSTPDTIIRHGFERYLLRIREDLYNIANALNQQYFAYLP